MTIHTSDPPRPGKARKPPTNFPLTLHPTGRWCKKVKGKLHYFGRDQDAALQRWLDQRDDLLAGRVPRPPAEGVPVKDACNLWLTAKTRKREAGEIGLKHWSDCRMTTDRIVAAFGRTRAVVDLAPADFARLRADLARRRGPVALVNEISRIKSVFRYAYDAGLLDKPVRFGPDFVPPPRRLIRLARAEQGSRLLTAEQCRRLLGAAPPKLRAMILLALNTGFGNTDCARLPLRALDLEAGWVRFARPKTGIARRCPLWPETVKLLREVLARRKPPRDPACQDRVFITKQGNAYVAGRSTDGIGLEIGKLLRRLGLKRRGVGFYTLRRVFRTVADEALDAVAAATIMGHVDSSMAGVYREQVADARLVRVSEHVRQWLKPWEVIQEAERPT